MICTPEAAFSSGYVCRHLEESRRKLQLFLGVGAVGLTAKQARSMSQSTGSPCPRSDLEMRPPPPSIPGGFAKSWRKELDSEIWLMPPLYHRVWYWLRMNVQHEPFLFPTRERFGIWVLPGQRITSLQQIAEGVKWTEWGKEKVPNKRTIMVILDWLANREMVTVESNGRGTLINLVNWSTYNSNSSEKVTA
jgi:hypothetical protein